MTLSSIIQGARVLPTLPSATQRHWLVANCARAGGKAAPPAASRRTSIRKPSCLISCSQPAPAGELSAGLGRQGSQKSGKATRRNNMGDKYQGARTGRARIVPEK